MKHKRVCIIFMAIILLLFINAEQYKGLKRAIKNLDNNIPVGRQWVVLIAIDKYKHWQTLKNPVKDVMEFKKILSDRYYIDEFIEIYNENATKKNILKLLVDLQQKVKTDDSLLIIYSGHGYLDKYSNTSYWISVDGGLDIYAKENWIYHAELKGYLKGLQTRHLCLISDSCFSGDLLDLTKGKVKDIQINNQYFKNSYERISRQVITSASSEESPDDSEFAYQLKMMLKGNNNPYLDPLMIFNQVRLGVKKTNPIYGSIKDIGHQDGASFFTFP